MANVYIVDRNFPIQNMGMKQSFLFLFIPRRVFGRVYYQSPLAIQSSRLSTVLPGTLLKQRYDGNLNLTTDSSSQESHYASCF